MRDGHGTSPINAQVESATRMKQAPILPTIPGAPAERDRELFSIVIPVFNSTVTLEQLVLRIGKVFEGLPEFDHEIIFVDDGSANPQTWPTLQRLSLQHHAVRAVQLMRNFGQNPATFCGMKLAHGDYIVTLDDDLQHAPEDIPLLIAQREHDVVFAQFRELKHSLYKRALSDLKNMILSFLIDKPKGLKITGFRLFRRELASAILPIITSQQATLPPLLFFMTRDIAAVQVEHHPRSEGKSNYTLRKVLRMARNLVLNESVLLLRMIGQVGFGIACLSIVGGLAVLASKLLMETTVAGWASLMIVLLIIGGLILFGLGIIGEYLARLISGVEGRPAFVVRREAPKDDSDTALPHA
jgi:dolichol-phosphate mannosyltransferase/undecaprenyl-phosphate 4-deoxy-4-formamido-L-arabinose transferase